MSWVTVITGTEEKETSGELRLCLELPQRRHLSYIYQTNVRLSGYHVSEQNYNVRHDCGEWSITRDGTELMEMGKEGRTRKRKDFQELTSLKLIERRMVIR
ncbi:hypothetical protein RUM44_001309 [Polyplax serrata]|uniref:Uncharacterized protein n=1 Tax=Polyplax serrata TaxID=468196 RepID=A0ABR1AKE0_POLSC